MNPPVRIAFLGWHDRARCIVEGRDTDVEILGIVDFHPPGSDQPDEPLPRYSMARTRLADLEAGTYLVDLRPVGSPEPVGLPPGVIWIPPEAGDLIEMLCGQSAELLRYKGVVETAQDAVVTINEDHRILFFNRAAEKMFGFSKKEVIGKDLNLIIPTPHRKHHREYVRRFVETRRARVINHTVELTAERRSGETFPVSISFSVAEEGEHLLMSAVLRDISEVKALEKRVLQNERLVSVGQALSYVTHEIKNPLMVIGGFARNIMRREDIQNEDQRRLDIIVKEVQRLEGLLQEIQDFTKPLHLEKEEIHLAPFLEEVLALFGGADVSPGVELSSDVQGDLLVALDPDRFRQVIVNLVKNALEAIDEKGAVWLRAWGDEGSVSVEVRDTGEGIARDRLEKIFEPFVTTKKTGSGLGLPLCRKIIHDHGGELTIESVPNQGTSVRIDLPRSSA